MMITTYMLNLRMRVASSQPNSPTIDHYEDDMVHPQGSNGSASENEMATTYENESALSEGDATNIPDTEHV
uniref:Ribonuclease H-like domain-containing protein n=1 Tax=Tanacetum cinerariifolium TaxID=118510 RepID=A0A6L2K503_TANCI|nr:ribonuclease H-like domain-containing protein [Tanacetum cinerariifolium]